MKTLILLFSVLFTTMSFAQVPSYVPASGLVGYWPFNGNANDESGNGNNGTVNGSALTSDRFGNSNTAYNFDGIDDFIEFGDITSLDNASAFSVSVFFNYSNLPTLPNDWYTLVADGSYADLDGWGILIKSDQILMRELDNYNGLNLNYNFTQNNWYHVAATCESDSIKIFINGQFIGGYGNLQPTLTLNTSNSFRVGNGTLTNVPPNTWPYYLSGKIDDLGLWNRALTYCEIQNLYTSTNPINTTTAAACNNYTWNGQTYTQSGVYTGTTANCITQSLNLTINPSTSSSISQTALDSYTWTVNNQTYTTSGAYTAVIPNAVGCDSTITLNLTMSFTDINELSTSKLSIYPNPTNGDFTITGLELVGTVSSLTLTDMNGKVVKVLDPKATKFSMASIKPGVYFLNIISENKQEVLKIVKE